MQHDIDRVVEDYLRSLEHALSGALAGNWDNLSGAVFVSSRTISDGKLVKLLEVADKGGPLCLCEDKHLRVLFARVGRIFIGPHGHVDKEGEEILTRKPTGKEVAKYIGMSWHQYRATLTEARKLVRKGLELKRVAA